MYGKIQFNTILCNLIQSNSCLVYIKSIVIVMLELNIKQHCDKCHIVKLRSLTLRKRKPITKVMGFLFINFISWLA